jgi:hypothetical protein
MFMPINNNNNNNNTVKFPCAYLLKYYAMEVSGHLHALADLPPRKEQPVPIG